MPKCRVSFFDRAHQMLRTLEVDSDSPQGAANIAYMWMRDEHLHPEEFGPSVSGEVVVTTKHQLNLASLSGTKVGAA